MLKVYNDHNSKSIRINEQKEELMSIFYLSQNWIDIHCFVLKVICLD